MLLSPSPAVACINMFAMSAALAAASIDDEVLPSAKSKTLTLKSLYLLTLTFLKLMEVVKWYCTHVVTIWHVRRKN